MTIEEFYKDIEEKRAKQKALNEAIEDDKETLVRLENEYKEALLTDNDKQSDSLFPQIEQLKERIKRNEHKAKTLKTIYDDGIKENAFKTALEIKAIKAEYQAKIDAVDNDALPLVTEINILKQKGNDLQTEFEAKKDLYVQLMDRYDMNDNELRRNGVTRYDKVETFKKTQLNQTLTIQRPTVRERRERKQVLSENPTIAEIAQSKRLIGGN